MRTHWFNPENDIALASGLANYTPPKAAVMVRQAGQMLPMWYASAGDSILCRDVDAEWCERKIRDFGIDVNITDRCVGDAEARPWGWSAYTRKSLTMRGCPETHLPADTLIEKMRLLSHRRTAAKVAEELRTAVPDIDIAPPAIECHCINDVKQIITDFDNAYIKMPWSSSGRGVTDTFGKDLDKVLRLAYDSIRHQGSVMVEKAHDKIMDFAKLFRCEDGKCTEIGTSVFTTDGLGVYTGNLLACEGQRLGVVTRIYDEYKLKRVVKALEKILTRIIAPYYSGILGVDMLIDSRGCLDAVVEINLRSTMGYVANCFADCYLGAGLTGRFVSKHISGLFEDYRTENGKLTQGRMLLSPTAQGFGFFVETAKIQI